LGTNKTPYLWSDHSRKSIYRNLGRKSKSDFCWILFVIPKDVSISENGICFVIQRMRCIGGISIRFVIYGMWWILNPACNISSLRYYIYCVYILLQFSNGR
jgi:hypothetical protein